MENLNLSTLLILQILKLKKQKCLQNCDVPNKNKCFDHLHFIAKNSSYILSYIFLNVCENKVPLEFVYKKVLYFF